MSNQVGMLLEAYAKDPVNQYEIDNPTISYEQGNTVCGDTCIVYLVISDGKISEFSHAGDPAIHTLAAASMLAEQIEGKEITEVMQRDYEFMKGLGFEVSTKRQRSAVTALLATKNALHQYLGDGQLEAYDDLLPN